MCSYSSKQLSKIQTRMFFEALKQRRVQSYSEIGGWPTWRTLYSGAFGSGGGGEGGGKEMNGSQNAAVVDRRLFRLFCVAVGDKYYILLVLNFSLLVGLAKWCICIYSCDFLGGQDNAGLEQSDARPPVVFSRLGVDDNLIRKGVGVGGGDGRNVVLVSVDNGDDLVRRFFEGFGHGAADFEHVYRRD